MAHGEKCQCVDLCCTGPHDSIECGEIAVSYYRDLHLCNTCKSYLEENEHALANLKMAE